MDPALLLFAFTAGAAAFFAPCCVAMLPAYVAYAVRPATHAAPTTPRPQAGLGRTVSLLGSIPLTLGALPLVARGLGSLGLLPDRAYAVLPTLEASLALLLVGAGLVLLGVTLAGKAHAARRGILFGALATLGFFLTFLAVGLPIAFLARGLAPYLGYLSVAVGLALVAVGVLMLLGKSFNPRLPTPEGDVSGPRGFFKFGLAYGVAGLSCTFPIFLAVIAAGLVSGGFTSAAGTFAAYAVGKASVLVAVTMVTVAGGDGLGQRMKQYARPIARASAWMLILAGAYMTWYFGRFLFLGA